MESNRSHLIEIERSIVELETRLDHIEEFIKEMRKELDSLRISSRDSSIIAGELRVTVSQLAERLGDLHGLVQQLVNKLSAPKFTEGGGSSVVEKLVLTLVSAFITLALTALWYHATH